MPTVVESSKGRAKLFNTLDRSGAHFISIGSGSSSDSEGNDSEDDGEQGSETRATQGAAACTSNDNFRALLLVNARPPVRIYGC